VSRIKRRGSKREQARMKRKAEARAAAAARRREHNDRWAAGLVRRHARASAGLAKHRHLTEYCGTTGCARCHPELAGGDR